MTNEAGSKKVDAYINASPKEAQDILRELRAILKATAPKAIENIKWGYPVLESERIFFSYSAHKGHVNFMPTRTTLAQFKKDLASYTTGQDTIQLPLDTPLPKALIKKIARYRVQEVNKGSLWKHKL